MGDRDERDQSADPFNDADRAAGFGPSAAPDPFAALGGRDGFGPRNPPDPWSVMPPSARRPGSNSRRTGGPVVHPVGARGYARARFAAWLRRFWPSVLFTLAAVALIATIPPDASVDRGNAQATLALPCLLAAVTTRMWRGDRGTLPAPLRLRRLNRMVFARAALICVYGALFALWISSVLNQAADDADFGSTSWVADVNASHLLRGSMVWLFVTAVVLVFVEPLAWLAWPAGVRRAAKQQRADQYATVRATRGSTRPPRRGGRPGDIHWHDGDGPFGGIG